MPSNIRGSDNFDSGEVIGQNQTWQDVIASRAIGTTYTNTTGKPISIAVSTAENNAANDITLTIDGSVVSKAGSAGASTDRAFVFSIIPPDSTYKITATSGGVIDVWVELR